MSKERVLISTHDLPRAGALREAFQRAGYATELVTPGERLSPDPDAALLVLTGLEEGGTSELARQGKEELRVPVLAIGTEDGKPPALRPGFDEVFSRSVSVADVVLVGRRTIERRRLRQLTGIVGETDAIHQVLERVVQIAPVASTVLITGESGTGKELVARGIHALSPRRHEPFIAVNVAALSETLLESELFGHEKGAFTGAIDARRGLFELADGGTIFLDEIGEMPLATQTKLLRVLEQREFHRVGGERAIRVDVRIIAATNQDLRQLVAIGEFRRDLYFRLNVLSIELPPLRERREDIPLLVSAFVREVSAKHDRAFPGISPEAMEILKSYSWPGNVRELRNLVESMVVLAPGRVIQPGDIPEEVRRGRGTSLLPVPVPRAAEGGEGVPSTLRPELEFVFRTLVELRVDIDDLRREFEAYRRSVPVDLGAATVVGRVGPGTLAAGPYAIDAYAPSVERPSAEEPEPEELEREEERGVVVYRPGMTIDEMERRAVEAALAEVRGNRRKAAELLGIGERTLYRKIAKYGLDV
ncbi:MAG TPA: sigma 54-interacting transcriptional regulator [Longimicrobiales bacterium]|nr:sigma 54-interacting transcriptional regulator [Longimicrobiales bacterium]